MKGICIDKGSSWHLQEGAEYFLEEYGPNHFSASKFNKPKSYFGIFRKNHFKLIDIEQPGTAAAEPDSEYKLAKLITWTVGMKNAGISINSEWAVKEYRSWGYAVYDPVTMKLRGIFQRDRLKIIGPYHPRSYKKPDTAGKTIQKSGQTPEIPDGAVCEQLSLFNF